LIFEYVNNQLDKKDNTQVFEKTKETRDNREKKYALLEQYNELQGEFPN